MNETPLVAPADATIASASFAQSRLWFLDCFEPGSAVYHIPLAVRLRGALDTPAVERALHAITCRHEPLRTTFAVENGEVIQVIHAPPPPFRISVDKIGATSSLADELSTEARRPFNLMAGPLWRAKLWQIAPREHVLQLTFHHIVSDGWSLGILISEFAAFYASPTATLPELSIQYADYAAWQNSQLTGPRLAAKIEPWCQRLAGADFSPPLETDRPRSKSRNAAGATHLFSLDQTVTRQLHELARAAGGSLHMALLTGFAAVLQRWSGRDDLVIGMPVANRNRTEVEPLIGFFVNALPLRLSLANISTGAELFGCVRTATLEALAAQDVPFEKLVQALQPERSLACTPLFQVMFVLQNAPLQSLRLPGLEATAVEVDTATGKYDLTLILEESAAGLSGRIEYASKLFFPATISRLAAHFLRALETLATTPSLPVAQFELAGSEELARLTEWGTGPKPDYPATSLPAVFSAHAIATPQAIALTFGEQSLTYADLNTRANRLAHVLREHGVTIDVPVGLCCERSLDLVVCLLGILKAGGAYLFLDPAYPTTRLGAMLDIADCPLVLTTAAQQAQLPATSAKVLVWESIIDSLAAAPTSAPAVAIGPDDLAYISFTSGSTGLPKGVAVPHRAVLRLVHGNVFANCTADEVFLLLAPITFDASTFELWAPLANGGRLVVMPPHSPTLEEIGRVVRTEKVTTLWLTAGLFSLMVDERLKDLQAVRQLIAGGDVLSVPHVAKALKGLPNTRLINGYGPTENTTFTCCHGITADDVASGSIPIGKPIGHTTVYVLDTAGRLTPNGVPGELYTGGDGLARGYVAQPELTAAAFVSDPVHPGQKLYRTGDRVRWRDDGTLQFLGRMDRQVKIRGHRIEPGEVEAALASTPGVTAAAIVVHDGPTGKRLIGYASPILDAATLQTSLARRLPEYLVPSLILTLPELPLNANGKVDRSALPPPGDTRGDAPQTESGPLSPTEEILTHLCARLLSVDNVRVGDNFFALGGHSLLATQLASRIREAFGLELPLHAIFEAATLGELAAGIESHRIDPSNQAPPLRAIDRPDSIPLSFAQERLWFLNQLEPGNPFYNMPAALDLRGRYDADAGRRVVRALVQRHESLRTVFRAPDGNPVQIILPVLDVPVTLDDLTATPDADRFDRVQRAIATEARRPFDLTKGPLLRVALLKLADDHHILLMTMHHIVSDGWSMGVLTREMGDLYAGLTAADSTTQLTPLALHYADYAIWQRRWLQGSVYERQLSYWKTQLADAPPVLALPTDRPRPAVQSYRGGSHSFTIDTALAKELTTLSRASGATLFMTIDAVFSLLLGRMARQEDVLIGTPIANRHRAEVEPLIGFFVNTLVLRHDLSGNPTFRDLLARNRRTALDAYTHQDLPFERLVDELAPERDLSRNPVFQVMFALHNTPVRERILPELTITDLAAERISAQFDVVLDVWETSDGLKCVLEFAADLFDASTIRRMAGHFQRLLAAVVSTPDSPVNQLPWLADAERAELLDTFNDSVMPYPDRHTLGQLIATQVKATPDRIAAVHRDQQLTYAELDGRANQLARYLISLGVGRNDFVGQLEERGLDFLVGLVAILKAGAAFIPIDPSYPADRVQHMLSDSGVAALLTSGEIVSRCRPDEARSDLRHLILFDDLPIEHPLPDTLTVHPAARWLSESKSDPAVRGAPEDHAYMLYTSGSTGRPKGAIIRHNGAINHIHGQFQELRFHADSAFLQSAPSSSDISVWQFLAPLLIGARTVIVDFEVVCEAPRLFDLVRKERITLFEFVPVVLKAFLDHAAALEADARALPALDCAMVTGEAVPVALINQWFEVYPDTPLVNAYGPTEAADDVCQAFLTGPLPPKTPTVPIGRTLPNLTLYVLDADLQLVPVGVPGEICVSGVGVGAGYWRNEEKTRAAFAPNPFHEGHRGDTLYRTGDLGRWLPDGNLEMLGRLDQQVKLRGFRIELGEIESMLSQHSGVAETVVRILPDATGEDRLIAWVTPDDASGEIRAQLNQLQDDQVSLWQDLHEDSYRDTLTYADNDPTFNVIGWDSNYTREPLSETEMREYVNHTVARVRELAPRRILEIGAGTGLLMFPLAKDCEHYLACDLSTVAIEQLRELTRDRAGYAGLELRAQQAHDFTGIAAASYDVVMLCSVVQYFPGIDYLVSVIEGALRALKPGGALFLGDVRVRSLLPAFHASVQLFRAGETLTAAGLRRRVREALQTEQEMAVDPSFFAALRTRFPQISRVQIRPKRASVHNEMTRFRADVTLHLADFAAEPVPAHAKQVDWAEQPLTLAELRRELATLATGQILHVRNIANARVQGALRTIDWLDRAPDEASVADFRAELEAAAVAGLESEDLLAIAHSFELTLDLAQHGDDGSFDAVFRPGAPGTLAPLDLFPPPAVVQPWRTYANHPLHEKLARFLAPVLRKFLRERLPSHMIPADLMVLEAFPQLPNGKIDRQSLPAPVATGATSTEDYMAPTTPTETKLAIIWAAVLGLDRVGVTANFFELGGHSLKATQVVSRIRQELEIEIALREMFNRPTVRELAAEVEGRRRTQHVPVPRTPDAPHYPLSHAQKRLWVLGQIEGALTAYNMPVSLELAGRIDRQAFVDAFTGLVLHHESLRTTLPEIDGQPRQVVHARPLEGLSFADLSEQPDPVAAARETALRDALAPFDFERGPLVRITLLRIAPGQHVLLFNIHHIISDDWSMGVLVREFMKRYDALASGHPLSLPPLSIQHRDFAVWHNARLASDDMAVHRAYWHGHLTGELPVLALATDFPRPALKTYRGRTHGFSISPAITKTLSEIAGRHRASLFMVLTAAVQSFLHRHSGQKDLIVGTPIAGRNHPDLETQIGFYINTLPLRARIDPHQSFTSFLDQVTDTITHGFEHQDYPFDRIVDDLAIARDVTRSPLFDVVVVMQNVDAYQLSIDGVTITPFLPDIGGSKFDLQFNFAEAEGGLACSISFNTDLFTQERITRFAGQLATLLESIALDSAQPIDRLNLLPPAERRRILREFNPAPSTPTASATLIGRFEAQVDRSPSAIALNLPGGESLTYRDLNQRANLLARHLITTGVDLEVPVALFLERSLELIVGLLGILKAGGAYLPIDPVYPPERIAFMLRDAKVPVIITSSDLRDQLPPLNATVIDLDTWTPQTADADASNLPAIAHPDSAAYIIYTSGSTGTPKGCIVSHQQTGRLFDSTDHWFRFGAADVWTLFHSHAFDFSVWEIWGALLFGGRLVIVPHATSRDPEAFLALLRTERVTVLNQTPSAFRQLSAADAAHPDSAPPLSLRTVIFGGEALDIGSLRGWWERHGDESPRLVNMYGITETTVHVTYRALSRADLDAAHRSVIGEAIPDLSLYLLDACGEPVPIGIEGEIHVGGAGVARGYLNRPELTAERFVPDPFSTEPGARLYRSGDLARWLPDGDLEYLGRADHQVKVRGFRIELGEIEAALTAHPAIGGAIVLASTGESGDVKLNAYLTPVQEAPIPTTTDLRNHLRARLPDYMVPSAFVALDSFPLTANGKIDRTKLADSGSTIISTEPTVSGDFVDELEETIGQLWRTALGTQAIGRHDNFFDLGGHSLLIVQVHKLLRTSLHREFPVTLLFKHATIAALAAALRQTVVDVPSAATPREVARERAQQQQAARQRRRPERPRS